MMKISSRMSLCFFIVLFGLTLNLTAVPSISSSSSLTTKLAFAQSSSSTTTTTTNNRTGIRSSSNNNSNLFLTYTNDILGIRMQYPSNWSAREYKYNNTMTSSVIATFYSPSKTASELGNISGVSGDFVPYLDIFVFTAPSKEKSLEKIVNETINKFLKNPDTAISNESKPFTLKSKQQPAYMLDYNTTISGASFRKMQLWTIFNSKVCVVTFTSQQALFSDYIPIVKKMFNSFEIVNRPQ